MALTKPQRIAVAGQELFGKRWLRPLARLVDIDHAFLSRVVKGTRTLTPEVAVQIADAIDAEVKRRSDTAMLAGVMADKLRAADQP